MDKSHVLAVHLFTDMDRYINASETYEDPPQEPFIEKVTNDALLEWRLEWTLLAISFCRNI